MFSLLLVFRDLLVYVYMRFSLQLSLLFCSQHFLKLGLNVFLSILGISQEPVALQILFLLRFFFLLLGLQIRVRNTFKPYAICYFYTCFCIFHLFFFPDCSLNIPFQIFLFSMSLILSIAVFSTVDTSILFLEFPFGLFL